LIDFLIATGAPCTGGRSPDSFASGGYQVGNRAFKTGQYVNTTDGFKGYIFGNCEENRTYHVAVCEHDEERCVSASGLTPWSPQNGERVTEIDNENSPIGIIVEAGEEESSVVWTGLRRQVSWFNSHLEPVWD
jgi:hypothetical protein